MNKLKITAFATAASLICSVAVSSSSPLPALKKSLSSRSSKYSNVSAEIISAEETEPLYERLEAACGEEDAAKINAVCDEILAEMNATKQAVEAYSADISEWADDEIIARQEKYENEVAVKYAQTSAAIEELRNGIDTEKNLAVLSENVESRPEHKHSDAVPTTEGSADSFETVELGGEIEEAPIYSAPPTDNDLKPDGDAEASELFRYIADSLGDANSIYLFVKNNFKNEAYSGSKKGAAATLAQNGGNDMDQAALLVALYRAKNIPARYVTGTVYITAEQAKEITGSDNMTAVGRVLATGHRNVKAVTSSGTITGFKMERTWVEAYIPYTDYRGAGNQSGDAVWVQLDPSFKKLEAKVESIKAEYSDDDLALLEMINKNNELDGKAQVSARENVDCHYRKVVETADTYIPASLPYTVLSVDDRYSFIKDSDKDTVSIYIDGESLMSLPVSELYGKSVTVSYEPESESDANVLSHYDRLVDVPAYLVNVSPVVTVGSKKYELDDDDEISWLFETQLGTDHQMNTVIKNCGGTTVLDDNITAGSMYAINLDLQSITPDETKAAYLRMQDAKENYEPKNMVSHDELGAFLDYAGKYYFSMCDVQEDLYASVNNLDVTKRLSLAITSYNFSKSQTFGITRNLDFGSFHIDVAYDNRAVISLDGDAQAEKNFMLACGMLGSYYEGYLWQELVDKGNTSVSTISVMNEAAKKGVEFRYLTPANAEKELAASNITDSVKDEVRDFINQGLYVELVPETIRLGTWEGTAYIAIDMKDGSASYMISGGDAGGSSMEFENLFELNNSLFLTNWELGAINLLSSGKDLCSGVAAMDLKDLAKGLYGIVGATSMLSDALTMRYSNYDYIFAFAEAEDEDAVMFEYKKFTLVNMIDTLANVACTVLDRFGDAGGLISAKLGMIYNVAKKTVELVYDKDRHFEFSDIYSTVWDYLGVLLAKL